LTLSENFSDLEIFVDRIEQGLALTSKYPEEKLSKFFADF
jgi:hypothetical protein